MNLTYQRDFEPGLHVRGDEDPIDINDIVGLTMNVEDLGDCADVEFEDYVGVGEIDQVGFGLFPNPADAVVEIVLDDLLLGARVECPRHGWTSGAPGPHPGQARPSRCVRFDTRYLHCGGQWLRCAQHRALVHPLIGDGIRAAFGGDPVHRR